MLLTAANRSYHLSDLTRALISLFPDQLPQDRHTFVAESEPAEDPVKDALAQELESVIEQSEVQPEDPPMEGQEVLASESILEESETISILVNWKEQRKALSKEKLARGFGQPRPDLNNLRRRNRCFLCKGVGHFSRDCPERKKGLPSKPKHKQSKSSEISMVTQILCGEVGVDPFPEVLLECDVAAVGAGEASCVSSIASAVPVTSDQDHGLPAQDEPAGGCPAVPSATMASEDELGARIDPNFEDEINSLINNPTDLKAICGSCRTEIEEYDFRRCPECAQPTHGQCFMACGDWRE